MYLEETQKKRLLTSLNPILILLLIIVFIVLKSGLIPLSPKIVQRWDILLPFIVYFGLRKSFIGGLILSIFSAHLYSLSSSAPIGFYVLYYLVLFFLLRLISLAIYADTSFMVLFLIFILFIISKLILPLIAVVFSQKLKFFESTDILTIILNTVFGFFSYWMLWLLDAITFKMTLSYSDIEEI